MINHKKYFKELQDEYENTVDDYKKFEQKPNKSTRANLIFSLNILSKVISKLRASLRNIYFGKQ